MIWLLWAVSVGVGDRAGCIVLWVKPRATHNSLTRTQYLVVDLRSQRTCLNQGSIGGLLDWTIYVCLLLFYIYLTSIVIY